MKFIIGTKIEMGQIWNEAGERIPVTWIKVEPCKVTQVKTIEKDGYPAVQVSCGKKKHLSKPLKGHFGDLGEFRYSREFRTRSEEEAKGYERGKEIKLTDFSVGDKVRVSGISKGRGFQGVVKRHGFAGSPASHGHKDQLRMPGSIGATDPAHVFKGTKMAGQMGNERVTVKNLEIAEIDEKNSRFAIKGAVPGSRNSLIEIISE